MTWGIVIAALVVGAAAGAGISGLIAGLIVTVHRRERVPFVDITRVAWIEVSCNEQRTMLWINGPDGLLFRAYHIGSLTLALPEVEP